MTTFSHNSGFADYYELRRAVWDSSEPLVVKALALAILEHMRPDKLDAYPSRSRLARMCNISEKTLERHWGAISQWIDIIKNRGQTNVYRARIYTCASELIKMLPDKPPVMMGGAFADLPPKKYPTKWPVVTATTSQRLPKSTPQNDQTEDSIEDNTNPPLIPPAEPREGIDWDNGRLVAVNGHAPALERLLGGRLELPEALAIVQPEITPGATGYVLEIEVAAAVQRLALKFNDPPAKPKREPKDRGTRLPNDFVIPKDWRDWVKTAHGLQDGQIDWLATGFVRYWTGPDARNPMKKDWLRTWQNNVDSRVARGEIPFLKNKGLASRALDTIRDLNLLDRL